MIIPLIRLVPAALSLALHYPRHKQVLFPALVPPPPAPPLLQRPHVDEHLAAVPHAAQELRNRLAAALGCREVVHDRNANRRVRTAPPKRQRKRIRNQDLRPGLPRPAPRQLNERRAAVGGEEVVRRPGEEVLTVSAPGVQDQGAGGEGGEEGGYEGPGLVAGRGEVRGYGFVDCVDVGFLVVRWRGGRGVGCGRGGGAAAGRPG